MYLGSDFPTVIRLWCPLVKFRPSATHEMSKMAHLIHLDCGLSSYWAVFGNDLNHDHGGPKNDWKCAHVCPLCTDICVTCYLTEFTSSFWDENNTRCRRRSVDHPRDTSTHNGSRKVTEIKPEVVKWQICRHCCHRHSLRCPQSRQSTICYKQRGKPPWWSLLLYQS